MFPIRDHNPSEQVPYVTIGLIFINVVMYLLTAPWAFGLTDLWIRLALYPVVVVNGENLWSLITHMFLHAGPLHIFGNMLFLWIFGDNLEDQLGHISYLLFYLACGLTAAAAQIAVNPSEDIPMVGASGAVAGVMGGYLLLFPKARVDVIAIIVIFIKLFSIPAWVMLGVWFLLQLFGAFALFGSSNVAYWAHTGGFIAGIFLVLPIFIRHGGVAFWQRTQGHPQYLPVNYSRTRIPEVRR